MKGKKKEEKEKKPLHYIKVMTLNGAELSPTCYDCESLFILIQCAILYEFMSYVAVGHFQINVYLSLIL